MTKTAGHLHVLRRGVLTILNKNRPPTILCEPTILLYPRPGEHTFQTEGADIESAESEADAVLAGFQQIRSARDAATEQLTRNFAAPKIRIDYQMILGIAFSVWRIPPRAVTAKTIEQVLHLLASKAAGGVELDSVSCEAARVDPIALAQEMRTDLRRRSTIWTVTSGICAADRPAGISDSSVHLVDAVGSNLGAQTARGPECRATANRVLRPDAGR